MARKQGPEQVVKQAISEYLESRGHFFWWAPSTGIYDHKINKFRPLNGRFHRRGVSDILGLTRDGVFFAIECKAPKSSRVSEDQEAFINIVDKFGGIAFVARSVADVVKNGL